MEALIITPRTKVYDLLEAYPELEDTLIQAAPQFKKLKNPVLRKTIARVTNLSQAAIIGGLKVEELVNTLREAAGQHGGEDFGEGGNHYELEKPDWFEEAAVAASIDITGMLNEGEQPVHEVLSSLKALKEGEILKTHAPFIPAPLIDKATGLDYLHWINEVAEDEFHVYFLKNPESKS